MEQSSESEAGSGGSRGGGGSQYTTISNGNAAATSNKVKIILVHLGLDGHRQRIKIFNVNRTMGEVGAADKEVLPRGAPEITTLRISSLRTQCGFP